MSGKQSRAKRPSSGANGAGGKSRKKTRAKRKTGLGKVDDDLLYVLSNPLRLRMLVSLNEEGNASPSDLSVRLNAPLGSTSYHMKVLREKNFAEIAERDFNGRGMKTIYRAIRKAEFPQEVWERLPPPVQNQVLVGLFLTSYADAQEAIVAGAFEKHPESHATWTTMELKPEKWQALRNVLERALEEVLAIGKEAKEEKENGVVDPEELLSISLSMFAFPLLNATAALEDRPATLLRHNSLEKRP